MRTSACFLSALVLGAAVLLPAPTRAADPFLRRTPAVRAVEKVGPSVVNITTERIVGNRGLRGGGPFAGDPFFERFFQDFFEPGLPRTDQSLGSGVIIDAEGHVLTNQHVVARASRIRVTLADGRGFDAELVGADANNDLAVLKLTGEEKLPWTPPGNSAGLLVGEPVIAIGNPFGLSNTVTTGVISAIDRSIRTEGHVYHGFLQTDASINPGNSGGPLLDAEGDLIGINTAIYGGGAQGIGFAIPIDSARRVVRELIEHGEVAPVWLGLHLQDLDPQLTDAFGLAPSTRGALVSQVRERGPARRAGVSRGDVVTAMDGRAVRSAGEFYEMLSYVTNGQTLHLAVLHDGESRDVAVQAVEVPDSLVPELMVQLVGVQLEPEPGGGFRVTEVRSGSGVDRIGVQAGDYFLQVNGRTLTDEEALRRSVLELRGRSRAMIVVQRGRGRYHVTIPLA